MKCFEGKVFVAIDFRKEIAALGTYYMETLIVCEARLILSIYGLIRGFETL